MSESNTIAEKITILLPAFNEEQAIGQTIGEIKKILWKDMRY